MSSDKVGTSIEIEGVGKTIRALKEFTPDIHKDMNKAIRTALNWTKQAAIAKYPKGAYTVRINKKKILGSVATAGGASAPSWNDAAPGVRAAIFEFAGSQQQGKSPQAQALIASLNSRYGTPGRFLWSAWDETGDQVTDSIRAVVKRAEARLQERLNAAGEGF